MVGIAFALTPFTIRPAALIFILITVIACGARQAADGGLSDQAPDPLFSSDTKCEAILNQQLQSAEGTLPGPKLLELVEAPIEGETGEVSAVWVTESGAVLYRIGVVPWLVGTLSQSILRDIRMAIEEARDGEIKRPSMQCAMYSTTVKTSLADNGSVFLEEREADCVLVRYNSTEGANKLASFLHSLKWRVNQLCLPPVEDYPEGISVQPSAE